MKRPLIPCTLGLLALLGGCDRVPGNQGSKAEAAPAVERSLASYLRNLSPRVEGVTPETATLEHYSIPTRSGAVLDAWVRRPPGEFGQPLLLTFTPYYHGGSPADPGREQQLPRLDEPDLEIAQALLPYGYAVGWVSVGGTGNSTGCFRNGGRLEREQMVDAVQHLAAQSWSNGAVGAIGLSYDGTTAVGLLAEAPPALKAIVPVAAISDYYRYSYNNGMRRSLNSLYTTTPPSPARCRRVSPAVGPRPMALVLRWISPAKSAPSCWTSRPKQHKARLAATRPRPIGENATPSP